MPAAAPGPSTPLARSPRGLSSVSAAGSDSATASPVLSGAASSSKLRDHGMQGPAARQSVGQTASSAQGTPRLSAKPGSSSRSTEPAVSLRELEEALQPRAATAAASPASEPASLSAARKRAASPLATGALAALPIPSAHPYTVAEGHAAEAQRVRSELAELLANPLLFTMPAPSKLRNIDLPAINGARQAAAQVDEQTSVSLPHSSVVRCPAQLQALIDARGLRRLLALPSRRQQASPLHREGQKPRQDRQVQRASGQKPAARRARSATTCP
jgi:hypothetical protein